jgi:NAD(P)-dependent dehydrogenase (short-subunit alcohol dehydrogenase family)
MSRSRPWSTDDMPDLTGRIAVVTGANSGLGRVAAEELARAGAHVVLACRDQSRAAAAIDAIVAAHPAASVEARALDLASLASVREFSDKFRVGYRELHILCNNAGVMALPRRETVDGFEMQLGTNHLGHFALTGLLLDRLVATPGSRVVTTSSTAHRIGKIRFDDLQSVKSYSKWGAYGQSKLANLLFAYELQRRLAAARFDTASVACHPGYAATNLQAAGPRMEGSQRMLRLVGWANDTFSQSAEMGALPTLYAAASPDVRGGDYIGPADFFETWGPPVKVPSSARSHDAEAAARLWEVSQEQTGVDYSLLKG